MRYCNSISREYGGKVQVVNNQRISVTQRQSVLDALALRDVGKTAAEIKEVLEAEKNGIQHLHHTGNTEISQKKAAGSLRQQQRSELFST